MLGRVPPPHPARGALHRAVDRLDDQAGETCATEIDGRAGLQGGKRRRGRGVGISGGRGSAEAAPVPKRLWTCECAGMQEFMSFARMMCCCCPPPPRHADRRVQPIHTIGDGTKPVAQAHARSDRSPDLRSPVREPLERTRDLRPCAASHRPLWRVTWLRAMREVERSRPGGGP